VLLLVGWLGYVSYLTIQNDRACGGQIPIIKESNYTQNDEELQPVLDNCSGEKKRGAGLQATVIFPDGTTWSGVSGYANHKKKCPLTLDHHLCIGSLTKLFTATLVMEQVENGTIALDDPLSKWIDLPYAKKITVGMLLNHTSGIPSYTEDLWFLVRWFGFPRKQWQPDELVAVIRNKGLNFEPGSRHEYSNSNYLLLGVILEKATGKSYGTLLQELANKIGLQNTYYLNYSNNILIANGYDETFLHLGRRNLAGFRRSLEAGAFSAGGILTTSKDVAFFVHSLFTGRILDSSTLAQMKTFVDAPDRDMPLQKGYGLGIRNLVIGGENLIGHTGTIPGYSGIAMHNEEKHYTIVILSNLSVTERTQLFEEVQHIVGDRLQMRRLQNIHLPNTK